MKMFVAMFVNKLDFRPILKLIDIQAIKLFRILQFPIVKKLNLITMDYPVLTVLNLFQFLMLIKKYVQLVIQSKFTTMMNINAFPEIKFTFQTMIIN